MTAPHADLDLVFHALSDQHRRAMVERLSQGPASVKELAAPAALLLSSALKHLKVLEAGGMVVSEKSGRVRTYSLRAHSLDAIGNWLVLRKKSLNDAFDRLERLMAEEGAPEEN
jgi:DNA-binding transcriptional ArsR family regulator